MKFSDLEQSTRVILKVFLVLLGLGFLWVIRDIIIILLIAVILASAMDPLVSYFKLKRVPRALTVFIVYVIVFSIIGVIISLIAPPVIEQLKLLEGNLPDLFAQFQEKFPNINVLLGNPNLSEVARGLVSSGIGHVSLVSGTLGFFNGFFTVITILVISFYLVAEERSMKEFIRTLIPEPHEDFAMNLVTKIQHRMGRWVLGQLFISLMIFLFTFLGLTLLNVRYALFLALLAGLLEIIPFIGPFVSAVPAVFFGFIQSPPLAIAVIVLYIVVQKTENYVLLPKVMEKTVGISPLVVLLALLVGLKLGGILGLLIAVPLAGAINVVIQEFTQRSKEQAAV